MQWNWTISKLGRLMARHLLELGTEGGVYRAAAYRAAEAEIQEG